MKSFVIGILSLVIVLILASALEHLKSFLLYLSFHGRKKR